MPDRIAEHAINARAATDFGDSIEFRHFAERELSRGCGLIDCRIRYRASHARRQDASGKSKFAHGYGNSIAAIAGYFADVNTVRNRVALRGDLDCLSTRASQSANDFPEGPRRFTEIVIGHHNARWRKG